MKNLLLFFPVLLLCTGYSCHSQPQQTAVRPQIQADGQPHSLIIYYNPETGKKPLLKAIKTYPAKILYEYENFNGIAVAIPKSRNLDDALLYFQKIEGVLQVQNDQSVPVWEP